MVKHIGERNVESDGVGRVRCRVDEGNVSHAESTLGGCWRECDWAMVSWTCALASFERENSLVPRDVDAGRALA